MNRAMRSEEAAGVKALHRHLKEHSRRKALLEYLSERQQRSANFHPTARCASRQMPAGPLGLSINRCAPPQPPHAYIIALAIRA
eukprot:scaffold194822_cov19-Prasinocladus_malaysianus.AAC.1